MLYYCALRGTLIILQKRCVSDTITRTRCVICAPPIESVTTQMVCTIFSASASWMGRLFSAAEWRSLYDGNFLHWLFHLVGVNQHCLEPDELHVWHLGVAQYAIGSVLFVLTYQVLTDTPQRNMDHVWKHICEFYHQHATNTQYSHLGLRSFCHSLRPHGFFHA